MVDCKHVLLGLMLVVASAGCGDSAQARDPQEESSTSKKIEVPLKVLRPFLWELETTPTSYLFGTIHVPDPRVIEMHPRSREAFQKADSLYTEIDMKRDAMAQSAAMVLPGGKKLNDLCPQELLDQIDRRLAKISPAFKRSMLPQFKVYTWPILIPSLEIQLKNPNALVLDMKLFTDAANAGKTVGGLEKPKEQFREFDALSLEEQIKFTKSSLDFMDDMDAKGIDPMEELLALYLQGEVEPLEVYMNDQAAPGLTQEMTDKILNALLIGRNERMAEAIDGILKAAPDKSHFFAVGTAHLIGEGSIQEFLAKHGYKAKRAELKTVEAGG